MCALMMWEEQGLWKERVMVSRVVIPGVERIFTKIVVSFILREERRRLYRYIISDERKMKKKMKNFHFSKTYKVT